MKKILHSLLITGIFVITLPTIHAAKITAEKIGSRINITVDGRFFTSYIFSEDEKYPFFYPVN